MTLTFLVTPNSEWKALTHILVAVLAQLIVGLLFRKWLLGGILAVSFYMGREITQAEYRWISSLGEGRRANMPWWGGFDPQVWNFKSLGDVLLPAIAVVVAYGIFRTVLFRQR